MYNTDTNIDDVLQIFIITIILINVKEKEMSIRVSTYSKHTHRNVLSSIGLHSLGHGWNLSMFDPPII